MSYKIARGRVPTGRPESASKPTKDSHKTASRRTDPRAAANTTAQNPHTPSPTASVRR